MKSFTIRVTKDVLDFLQSLAKFFKVHECLDVKDTVSFHKCVSKITTIIKNIEYDDDECLEKCLDVVKKYINVFGRIDKVYYQSIKHLTSHGDSVVKQEEVSEVVKRIARHIAIDPLTVSIHIYRREVSKKFFKELLQCLIRSCGIERVENYINDLINYFKRFTNIPDVVETIEKIEKFLKNLSK